MSARGIGRWTMGVGLLAACVAMAGCGVEIPPDGPEPVELRTYEVPPEHKDTLRQTLNVILSTNVQDGGQLGRVTGGPGGALVVVAPQRIHDGIEELLAADFESPPAPARVQLSYWFLVGRPLASPPGAPFSVVGTDQLSRLEPVLSEIAAAQGPTEFTLLEHTRLTSMSGSQATARGRFLVVQTVTRQGERITANVVIGDGGNNPGANAIESQVTLDAGQFLVLGQAGYTGPVLAFTDSRQEAPQTLYVIMAAE